MEVVVLILDLALFLFGQAVAATEISKSSSLKNKNLIN
jgi:hypothetical protein